MTNAQRLKTATNQPTLIAAAFEAGRVANAAGRDIYIAHPTKWRAHLRRAFLNGFYTSNPASCAPASWVQR